MKRGSVQPEKELITIKLNNKEKPCICKPKECKSEMIITQITKIQLLSQNPFGLAFMTTLGFPGMW